MFDGIGTLELLVVLTIVLLVLGPERTPLFIHQCKRWQQQIKQAFGQCKEQVEQELQVQSMAQLDQQAHQELQQSHQAAKTWFDDAKKSVTRPYEAKKSEVEP
jgi:sec-independent protein translocase protein TatB